MFDKKHLITLNLAAVTHICAITAVFMNYLWYGLEILHTFTH